jgi:ABC-type sugar transport system ATPase subunit
VSGLGVTFEDGTQALDGVGLDVADGELLVLVGPSGCGKSTLLRCVAGLQEPSEGRIEIDGKDVTWASPRDRDVAMVFQSYALYPHLTVRDNLAFGLRLRGVSKAERRVRAEEVARTLGIEETLDRRPRALSGGQRQRVAMGRAIVRDPGAFLMDEPLSNLDAKLRVQTRGEIKRLQQEVRTTTVYVTHDQVEAMTMGDRIAVMNGGRLQQVGTPEELYDHPRSVFVGGFIGSPGMAFVSGVLEGGAGRLRGPGFEVELAGAAPAGGGDGSAGAAPAGAGDASAGGGPARGENGSGRAAPASNEVVLGVRPEFARPWADDAGLAGPLAGVVAYVEALGRETFVGVELAPGSRLVVQVPGRAAVQPGERMAFGLVLAGLRFFEPATGEALALPPSVRIC